MEPTFQGQTFKFYKKKDGINGFFDNRGEKKIHFLMRKWKMIAPTF